MTDTKKTNLPILITLGAFLLALALRLIRLGHLPLGDLESTFALQALADGRGEKALFTAFPAYVGLTGLSFFLLNAGNFLARFWPALIGALVVFIPTFFKEKIGTWPAAILSLVLAVSPDMVGLSRIIRSSMMAFVLLLLGIGLFVNGKPILSGIALALALMSGPGFWMGVLILGVSVLLSHWLFGGSSLTRLPEIENQKGFWTRFGLSFGATLLVVGTGFFLEPANLTGVFSGLVEFLRGFTQNRTAPLFFIPLALVAYTVEAFILGLWGSVRAILVRSKVDLFLAIWWLVGLSFIMLYPAGSAVDIIWVTLPLWLLTVRVMFFAFKLPETSRMVTVITTILVVVVFAFMLVAFRGLINPAIQQEQQVVYLLAMIGGVVLLVAVILLVSFGWSQEVALPGLLMGLAIVFVVGLFALSVKSTGLAPERSDELWYPNEGQVSTIWLGETIDRVNEWNAVHAEPLEIAVADFDSPAMRWFLRDAESVNFVPYPPPQSQPAILITSDLAALEISNSYRGQDLAWSRTPDWSVMTPFEWLRWLLTREVPASTQQLIIWVRTDLMPDSQFSQ
jgi:hypothetical protein